MAGAANAVGTGIAMWTRGWRDELGLLDVAAYSRVARLRRSEEEEQATIFFVCEKKYSAHGRRDVRLAEASCHWFG